MRTIVAIVGDSGSGKTLASMILKEIMDWNLIVSFTTRPIRAGELNGREHWFVKKTCIPDSNKMCAYTIFGHHQYWTEWGQFSNNSTNVYVIDESGLINLQSKEVTPFPFHLVTIKMKRKDRNGIDSQRIERDKDRVSIPDEWYDYVINNDDSIDILQSTLYLVGKDIERKAKIWNRKKTNQ